jgi:hypothetical protein
VVGARLDDHRDPCLFCDTFGDRGSAYVFVKPAAGWSGTQNARLFAGDSATGDQLGLSIGVGDDAIVVGAHLDDSVGKANHGSAYVFVKPAAGWGGTPSIGDLKSIIATERLSGLRYPS